MDKKRQNTGKAKMGRPSKFDGVDLSQVKILAQKGLTDREMAEFFHVDERTWHRWKLESEDFCQSLKEWKTEADERVERSLYERALGYSHPDVHISSFQGEVTITPIRKHYPPDTVACIFWLKNRKSASWRDKPEDIDDDDDNGIMVEIEYDE